MRQTSTLVYIKPSVLNFLIELATLLIVTVSGSQSAIANKPLSAFHDQVVDNLPTTGLITFIT
jgi:hypothetical protein